ncbi:hypothetical protein RI129_002998 [Pyrocoelia pectoralis]|uniref:Uncharacterized protein n=1 Tax=Pyrocoelia pectoralis TaxID=417401 RepID=A0AAN7VN45_9COLE
MRVDEITRTIKKDLLICNYASSYLKGRKSKGNLDAARTDKSSEINQLLDELRPHHFKLIIAATSELAKYNEDTATFQSPSLAVNFGTLLKKCCDLALGTSILNEKKWNKDELLPLTSDLKKLNIYLQACSDNAYDELLTNDTNRTAYNKLKESEDENELQAWLTETEKILLQTYSRIIIRGKMGRGVPVLLSPKMKQHFDRLIELRPNFVTNNDFAFHTSGSSFLDGTKLLQKYAERCGIQPTITQLLQFSKNDLEQLSKFMGHTLNTHCNVYRLPDNIYQTAKVSKLLLLMNDEGAERFKGRTLDEIDIELTPIQEDHNIFEELSESNTDCSINNDPSHENSQPADRQDPNKRPLNVVQGTFANKQDTSDQGPVLSSEITPNINQKRTYK